jgi:hypothetical protein
MSITFKVDSVQPIGSLSNNTSPIESISAISKVTPEAFGSEVSNLISPDVKGIPGISGNARMNGFLRAVHEAYSNHYGLVISPDDIWLAIAQGFSNHVNANAEALRKQFVKHEGKEEIKVRRDLFVKGSPGNDWEGCFSEFSQCISDAIGEDKRSLLVSDFSTTKALHRAVSEVTMMNTLKAYFNYVVYTKCGIPTITLTGDKADWEHLDEKVCKLKQFQCEKWANNLLDVISYFIQAYNGNEHKEFWTNIYMALVSLDRDGNIDEHYETLEELDFVCDEVIMIDAILSTYD